MTEHLLGKPQLILRRDAVTSGWSDGELARRTGVGGLHRVRRGAYVGVRERGTTAVVSCGATSHGCGTTRWCLSPASRSRTPCALPRISPDHCREAAVAVLDAALHEKLISAEELALRLPDILGTPGSRSGSVVESRSRIVLAGLDSRRARCSSSSRHRMAGSSRAPTSRGRRRD